MNLTLSPYDLASVKKIKDILILKEVQNRTARLKALKYKQSLNLNSLPNP